MKDQMCFYMFLKWFERFFRNYKVTKQYTVLAITVVTVKFSNIVAYSTKWLKTDKRIKCRQHCCFWQVFTAVILFSVKYGRT